jgi:uncharacterized protein (TIGR00730 family)
MPSGVKPLESLCVFCGSSVGNDPAFAAAAHTLGVEMARRGITLVYGGGQVGLMGIIADAVLQSSGRVIGVIPRHLLEREIAHRSLTELRIVETMHARKQLMADLAEAFVLMPGGFGSWDEFCEVVTWSQLGLHRKPLGILNVLDYYSPFLAMADQAVQQGFVRAGHRDAIVVADDAVTLLVRLGEAQLMSDPKWLPSGVTGTT